MGAAAYNVHLDGRFSAGRDPDRILAAAGARGLRRLSPDEKSAAVHAFGLLDGADAATGLCPGPGRVIATEDIGDTILATLAAQKIGLITRLEAATRLSGLVASVAGLSLAEGRLPAPAYDPSSLSARSLAGESGWRAQSVMWLASALICTSRHHPHLATPAAQILQRWDLRALITGGAGPGAPQTGLGEMQFAARTANLLGLQIGTPADPTPAMRWAPREPLALPLARNRAEAAVVTPDAILRETLLFGGRPAMLKIAAQLMALARFRFQLTSATVSFGRIRRDAGAEVRHGIADTTDGVAATGEPPAPAFATGTAAAIWAVFGMPYGKRLRDVAFDMRLSTGFSAGEEAGPRAAATIGATADILLALHYRAHGPLAPFRAPAPRGG